MLINAQAWAVMQSVVDVEAQSLLLDFVALANADGVFDLDWGEMVKSTEIDASRCKEIIDQLIDEELLTTIVDANGNDHWRLRIGSVSDVS